MVAHQNTGSALRLEELDHGQYVGLKIDKMGWPQERLIDPRHGERLQLMLAIAVCQGTQFLAQIGKQQGPKGGIRGDQFADRQPGQLIGQHLFGCHEAATDLAGHQCTTIKAIVRPVIGNDFGSVKAGDIALDDDKKMRRCNAQVKNRLTLAKVSDIHTVANQLTLLRIEAVKR